MFNDDEGPRDWEVKDEEPPEALKQKWARDETPGVQPVICPFCKKENSATSLACIFCCSALSQMCCPVSRLFSWIKRILKKG